MKLLAGSALSVSVVQFLTTTLAVLALMQPLGWPQVVMILVGYFLYSGLGVSIFYHRYWSHRSFKTSRFMEVLGTAFGVLAGRGSPLGWVAVHRLHHKHADGDLDPHSPSRFSWKVFLPHLLEYGDRISPFMIKDLLASKVHRWVNSYYNVILLVWVLLLAAIGIDVLLYFWVVPVALTAWVLNLFVFLSHVRGYRSYSTRDNSRNNWLISLLLWGEGWHNNHHHNPGWWNLHKKWWEIDLSGMIIGLIRKPA